MLSQRGGEKDTILGSEQEFRKKMSEIGAL